MSYTHQVDARGRTIWKLDGKTVAVKNVPDWAKTMMGVAAGTAKVVDTSPKKSPAKKKSPPKKIPLQETSSASESEIEGDWDTRDYWKGKYERLLNTITPQIEEAKRLDEWSVKGNLKAQTHKDFELAIFVKRLGALQMGKR